ncbi:substrate-binding domain-containing protein [Pseudonocardia kunmingensis]|uniref:GntR family transcriptional regulator n=1 Tax=Pseudonocardia kunmingensis TaxID=630975 RepID=A0A543D0L7_9PSEU|nr:substrate-binding domain-containing protein [Pseudonocardia kunmingensis]TQM02903.1 GntR family transcriptional regulator [Pseudonocardia kunmingensis]
MRLSAERRELILAAVRTRGTVRLSELVGELGVSPVTLRRDVTALADSGLVTRVHGGITLPRRAGAASEQGPPRSAVGPLASRVLVGMVVPSVDYYWPAVVQGAQTALAAAGSRLALRGSSYDATQDRRQVARLLERGVQSLLVAPDTTGRAGAELLRWLGGLPLPVALVERLPPPELPTLALDAATTDHALGAGLGVRHLATLGHRRVGLVVARPSPTSRAVRRGWRTAVEQLGLAQDGVPDLDVPSYGQPGWAEAFDDVLDRCHDGAVRALLVHSDREAIGILERARDRDVAVPGELAVVSYDDEVASASDPPLTAVRPDKHRLGSVAAELALARVADPSARPVHRVSLWPQLVVRESCGASPER